MLPWRLPRLLFVLPLFLSSFPTLPSATQFVNIGFNTSSNIRCFQGASLSGSVLQLTATGAVHGMGRCLYATSVRLLEDSGTPSSFSTQFIFTITPGAADLADGIAFVMAPSLEPVNGSSEGYLGIFSNETDGKNSTHTLAIEFDTYNNPEFDDLDGNHVAIDVNSIFSWHSTSAALRTTNASQIRSASDGYAVQMKGSPIQAWIDYNASTNQLNVSISRTLGQKPVYALISNTSLNLSSVLNKDMYIGFTASTSQLSDVLYYLHAWSFSNEGNPSADVTMPSSTVKKQNSIVVIAVVAVVALLAVVLLGLIVAYVCLLRHRRRKEHGFENYQGLELALDQNSPQRFSYKELAKATQKFSKKNLLGRGGFGAVYKGKLPSTLAVVAVKRISKESKQGVKEFEAEVMTIGRLRHRNLVPLLGWCQERGFMLVYEFMPNGSLDRMLFEGEGELTWPMRLHILKGVAAAVHYLHEEYEQKIVHRDIKTSNVMLDAQMNARLGDFGLARLYGHDVVPGTTNVAGTLGYMAPESFYTRKATEKTDVFSFGALILEMVTGKKVSDYVAKEDCTLIEWLWNLHVKNSLSEAIDSRLQIDVDKDRREMVAVLELGMSCCYADPNSRPVMRHILQVLSGDAPPISLSSVSVSGPRFPMDFANSSQELDAESNTFNSGSLLQPK